WSALATLDLETTVKPRTDLSKFEIFLASYCSEALPAPYVGTHTYPPSPHVDAQRGVGDYWPEGFLLVKRSYGDWLMFPRDEAVTPMIRDGRWTKEPYPVSWTLMPKFAMPLAFRQGAEETPAVVLMAPPQDCFAISTPYQGESHYSMYLSLFGRDLKAGAAAKVQTRLVVTMTRSGRDILDLYQEYMKQVNVGE
ncbi:MAG: hypothetical protein JSW27_02920, partial [Phycisphaerales bacterium]